MLGGDRKLSAGQAIVHEDVRLRDGELHDDEVAGSLATMLTSTSQRRMLYGSTDAVRVHVFRADDTARRPELALWTTFGKNCQFSADSFFYNGIEIKTRSKYLERHHSNSQVIHSENTKIQNIQLSRHYIRDIYAFEARGRV